MLSSRPLAALPISPSPSSSPAAAASGAPRSLPACCSLGSREASFHALTSRPRRSESPSGKERIAPTPIDGDFPEEEPRIAGIHVPRQKHIPVPKAELLDAVLASFESKEDAEEFASFAKCLDLILHAEHKGLLEEMRTYYFLADQEDDKQNTKCSLFSADKAVLNGTHTGPDRPNGSRNSTSQHGTIEDEEGMCFHDGLDLKSALNSSPWFASKRLVTKTRVASGTHFQHSFMKLLRDAQFEELSARDLSLTYALNSDYLLTLPIYIDWKKASESNAIIFRRGYATEKQKGLLLVEKLDYLQSKLLQNMFFSLSKPLKKVGMWLNEALKKSTGMQDLQVWIGKLKLWLKEEYFPENSLTFAEKVEEKNGSDQLEDVDLPIWISSQRAASRYEGLLSPVGPRFRLIRKLLTWTGLIPSLPKTSTKSTADTMDSEMYQRPNFLPRITLSNIWEPATRESCGGNVWEMLKASVGILFQQSTLQEPAFQELILLYTDDGTQSNDRDKSEILPLQLKIYERIPIPDLPVVFPHKKLSFRILDTVRLDVATILGLLPYFVNYKFENIASSPSAIFLDVVAASALIILVFRVVLGYKQTADRYQLLVNKTLYEKTLASGFGSVHFILDASEQQKYKEAILVFALLLQPEKYLASCHRTIKDACEHFVYSNFKHKIEMPINDAMETLLRLNLVAELPSDTGINVVALSCSKACEVLKDRWDSLLEQKT